MARMPVVIPCIGPSGSVQYAPNANTLPVPAAVPPSAEIPSTTALVAPNWPVSPTPPSVDGPSFTLVEQSVPTTAITPVMGPVYIPCGGGQLPVQNGEISPMTMPPRGVPVRDNPPVIPCIGSNGLVQYAPNPVGGDMLVENSGCGGCTGGTISVQQGLAASRAVASGGAFLVAAAVMAVVASLVVIH
jgi:hypothetical protein